jgi:hypothetical protein
MATTMDELDQRLASLSRAMTKQQTKRFEQRKPPEQQHRFSVYNEPFPTDAERKECSPLGGKAR